MDQPVSQSAPSVADEILAIASWLVRAQVSKRTTDYTALQPGEQRMANIFALRYGVEGEEITTLQSIGDRYGLTRERIRQIVTKMASRVGELQVGTPVLDQLAVEVRQHLPATIAALDKALRPLLGESLSVVSADRFAREIRGRAIVMLTDQPAEMTAPWELVAVDPQNHDAEQVRAVRDVARRMVRSCGAAQIQFVAGAAGDVLKRGVTPDEAARACNLIAGFDWLAKEDGWFWLGPELGNRLLTVTRKVLAAAGQRVDVESIQGGMARARRGHYDSERTRPYQVEAPLAVLTAALRRVPWLKTIQYDDFSPRDPSPIDAVLSDVELAIYRMMKARGGIASRYAITRHMLAGGTVSEMGVQKCLDESPIFVLLDRGIFALRGACLEPGAFAAASAEVGGEQQQVKQLNSAAPDEDGYYSLQFQLTSYMVSSRFWDVPAALARVMQEGDYQVSAFDTPSVYQVVGKHHRLKQFVNKLVARGLVAGDGVLLRVQPASRLIQFEKIPA